MGGILGLYVGFSLLTIFEFFDLAFELIVVGVGGLLRRGIGPIPGGAKKEALAMDRQAETPSPAYYSGRSSGEDGMSTEAYRPAKKMTEVVC